jgi:hypothetical protein
VLRHCGGEDEKAGIILSASGSSRADFQVSAVEGGAMAYLRHGDWHHGR